MQSTRTTHIPAQHNPHNEHACFHDSASSCSAVSWYVIMRTSLTVRRLEYVRFAPQKRSPARSMPCQNSSRRTIYLSLSLSESLKVRARATVSLSRAWCTRWADSWSGRPMIARHSAGRAVWSKRDVRTRLIHYWQLSTRAR